MNDTRDANDLRQFGRYTIERPLGSGGMATVFAASFRGPGGAARPVALKLIHPHLAREEGFVRMFIDETRVSMAFQHRNIVQTFDAGEVEGRHFMAMERIDGFTLRDLITRLGDRPFPLDLALFVVKEVAAALHYAHSFSPELTGQPGAAIHRDVSPSNVLLSRAGDVKLADFGVARAAQGERSTSTLVKGKVTYMAPEQARGRAQPASDVFSLSAVLYEILSSRPLRHVKSIEDVLELPNPASIHAERPEVPKSIDALLKRALDVDPDARPTAKALRDALGKELHALRNASTEDLYDTLGALVASLPAPPSDPRAQHLARAMLEEARRLETLSSPAQSTAATVPSPTNRSAAERRGALRQRHPRGRAVGIIVALGLAGAAAGAALFLGRGATPSEGSSDANTQRREQAAPVAARSDAPRAPDAGRGDSRLANGRLNPRRDSRPRARRKNRRSVPKKVVGTRRTPRKTKVKPKPEAPPAVGKGTLHLNSIPWAHVVIGGKKHGVTPLEGLTLPAGRHRVVLENPEQKLKKVLFITIGADQVLRKVVPLRSGR